MKPKYAFIFALNAIISIGLAFAVVVEFSKEQQKERDIQGLLDQQRSEQQKVIKAHEEGEAQKQFEAQINLEAQQQLAAKRISLINSDLDKIDGCLKRVLDEQSGYANETRTQRDTQEELLRQLARCAKTEIGILVVEMQNAGFTDEVILQQNLDAFFRYYDDKIHDEHLSYDYADLGMGDNDHKKELDAESAKLLQAAFVSKRAIQSLKLAQKSG
ncbi:MAG: hypothetical protein WAO02_07575 [Verrucomicrobiia bacterium]